MSVRAAGFAADCRAFRRSEMMRRRFCGGVATCESPVRWRRSCGRIVPGGSCAPPGDLVESEVNSFRCGSISKATRGFALIAQNRVHHVAILLIWAHLLHRRVACTGITSNRLMTRPHGYFSFSCPSGETGLAAGRDEIAVAVETSTGARTCCTTTLMEVGCLFLGSGGFCAAAYSARVLRSSIPQRIQSDEAF